MILRCSQTFGYCGTNKDTFLPVSDVALVEKSLKRATHAKAQMVSGAN